MLALWARNIVRISYDACMEIVRKDVYMWISFLQSRDSAETSDFFTESYNIDIAYASTGLR